MNTVNYSYTFFSKLVTINFMIEIKELQWYLDALNQNLCLCRFTCIGILDYRKHDNKIFFVDIIIYSLCRLSSHYICDLIPNSITSQNPEWRSAIGRFLLSKTWRHDQQLLCGVFPGRIGRLRSLSFYQSPRSCENPDAAPRWAESKRTGHHCI